MGRPNHIPNDIDNVKLHLSRLKWVDGDYDPGGVYWGRSTKNIYWAYGESETEQIEIFVRANDRNEAKSKVIETITEKVGTKKVGFLR